MITVLEFEKAVAVFGFDSALVTAIWNTMADNPRNKEEFAVVYHNWVSGKYKEMQS